MTERKQDLGTATLSIHAGLGGDATTGAVKRPLVMANNYVRPFTDEPGQEIRYPAEFIYVRNGHPNAAWLEERLAALEGGEDCVVTASGVAAIVGTMLTLLNTGDQVISSAPVYVAVRDVLENHLPRRLGIATTLVDTSDCEAVRRAVTPKTRLIHIETPGNPTTCISDIAAIARISREIGALLTVDSTWSGMVTQKPLQLGADLVMHSLSKYINGHGDAVGGCVIGRRSLTDQIRLFALTDLGACISPFNAWQIMRGSATLPLRMERHCANAQRIAEFLADHPAVAWVRYPGLQSHPQYEIARRQMLAFSGMLNFDIKGAPEQRSKLLGQLRLFTHATCLGHDESLIMVYEWQGERFFRVSIGLEDAEDLIADLDQALRTLA
ncbi:MAG: trans-sulfuration enzyme family protein [Anaerolineae bacterium]